MLTYQQVGAPEKVEYVLPSMEVVLEDLKQMQIDGELQIDNCEIHPFEMHDGKMLYLITQHSQWNRKKQTFHSLWV